MSDDFDHEGDALEHFLNGEEDYDAEMIITRF